MIKIDKVEVFGFEGAIRGMRNPYESWAKSDSEAYIVCNSESKYFSNEVKQRLYDFEFVIGEADMTLAKKLIKGGSEHRKFLRMIHVQADVVAPRYWWAEMDKYKYVEANSSSTMHLITKRLLTQDDFSMNEESYIRMENLNECLNGLIGEYQNTKDERLFVAIKQMLPESYNQLRTIDTNYEALLSIYHQRKNHRLIEWKDFCKWCLTLPYFEEFIGALEC